jgi:hypothetical protein
VDLGRDYRGQAFLNVGEELFIGTDSTGVVYTPVPEPDFGAGAMAALTVLAWLGTDRRRRWKTSA